MEAVIHRCLVAYLFPEFRQENTDKKKSEKEFL